jgi:hypothetical protein
MLYEWNRFTLTRRGALKLAGAAGVVGGTRLYAANQDFWNKKEPSEWSSQEIDQLTTKSPWAKEVTAQYAGQGNDPYGSGGQTGSGGQGGGWGSPGGTGVPGFGIPGIGGVGGGRGRRTEPVETVRGTVRWETAKPILEALKNPIPDAFTNHYVISVNGLPLDPGARRRYQDDPDARSQTTGDMVDQLKGVTFLEPKGQRDVQPGIVQQQGSTTILFGFSKELLNLKPEDKEVSFTTQFGRVPIRAKFVLKDMMYRGELAV